MRIEKLFQESSSVLMQETHKAPTWLRVATNAAMVLTMALRTIGLWPLSKGARAVTAVGAAIWGDESDPVTAAARLARGQDRRPGLGVPRADVINE